VAFHLLHTRKNTSVPALTAVHCPNRGEPVAGVLSERMGMYHNDKARLEETLAEYERLRNFLRDLDESAEQVDGRAVEVEHELSDDYVRPNDSLEANGRKQRITDLSKSNKSSVTMAMKPEYRIVKWHREQPDTKQLASGQVFSDLTIAEGIKAKMEKYLPTFVFAIELAKGPADEPLR